MVGGLSTILESLPLTRCGKLSSFDRPFAACLCDHVRQFSPQHAVAKPVNLSLKLVQQAACQLSGNGINGQAIPLSFAALGKPRIWWRWECDHDHADTAGFRADF
jgi:hypothetical protein